MAVGPLFFGSTIWTFNWNPPYEVALRRLASTGCKGFELPIWSADTLAYYTPEKIRELKNLADGEGLKLTNVFCNVPFSRAAGAATSRADLAVFNGASKSSQNSARRSSPR